VLILSFKFSLFWRDRARKSRRPSLFEPSLKVQRDFAHNPPSGFEVPALDAVISTSTKLERSILHGAAGNQGALEVIGLRKPNPH